MRALVTGATGFVGSAVARALLARGWEVRTLVRKGSDRRNLQTLAVELAEGDLTDAASLTGPLADCQALFHVAADYRLGAPDPDQLYRVNVEGTRNILEACRAAGVARIVYTSSVATLALGPSGEAADETSPLQESAAVGAYKRSKVAAERVVEAMVASDRLPVVIVNPSTPIGPRDVRPTPTGRIIVEAARGSMPGYVDTGLNLVHVDDVSAGHVAALRRGRIGERYILGGQNVPLADMLKEIARLVGRPPPRLRFPLPLIYPVALAAEAIAAVTRREPFVTLDGLRLARHRMFFTSAKAERELGYRARPYVEGLKDAIDWFRHAGYLR